MTNNNQKQKKKQKKKHKHSNSTATTKLEFSIHSKPIQIDVEVPKQAIRPEALLPLFQEITNEVVRVAVELAEEKGDSVSCAKGCGACCVQLVPISKPEARMIDRLVKEMPEPRRQKIKERFENVVTALRNADLFDDLVSLKVSENSEALRLGHAYFELGIDCPFLEEGACSIHPTRPLKCREFLATSPAENCNNPTPSSVKAVELPMHVSHAVASLSEDDSGQKMNWMPLTLALWWVENKNDLPRPMPGTKIFEQFYKKMFADAE